MAEQARNDQGFTLAELLVVVVMFGVILAALFMGMEVLNGSGNITQRDAWVASSTTSSIVYLERTISQATSIDTSPTSNGTRIRFVTDQNLDGVNEQHTIEASGGQLVDSVDLMPGGVLAGAPTAYTLIAGSASPDLPSNANDSSNPLFTYLDSDSTTAVDPSNAKSVNVKVWIRFRGQTYSDETQIFLRNR